jgi:hypothetical protein
VGELAMLVRQLVHSLRKVAPDNEISNRALDYLKRKGLSGNPMRAEAQLAPQSKDCQRPECISRGCFGHCLKKASKT